MGAGMKWPLLAILSGALFTIPAAAQAPVGTISRGPFICELPGDAAGRPGKEQPDQNFSIRSASRYSSTGASGTYLRRGDRLIFTSGRRQGETYRVISPNFLRRVDEGELGRLRCVRRER